MKSSRRVDLEKRAESLLNNYSIKKKLSILYILCVLIPIIVTDSVVVGMVIREEKSKQHQEMQDTASAIEYQIKKTVDDGINISKNIYLNHDINNFLNTEFASPAIYYEAYQQLLKDSLLETWLASSNVAVTMYADNATIVNGGRFQRLEKIKEEPWYCALQASGKDIILYCYFDESHSASTYSLRKVSIIRRLNYYKRDPYEKVLKIDLDYSLINTNMQKANYSSGVYVCHNGQIIFSNDGKIDMRKKFVGLKRTRSIRNALVDVNDLYGVTFVTYVLHPKQYVWKTLCSNVFYIMLLVIVNVILPTLFVRSLSSSFVNRLKRLSDTFNGIHEEHLKLVKDIDGTDEIGTLMCNYNCMATRINELIETVYISKLKQQEMSIAKQNAELLALRSQINPHFLFNILENIRMRSFIKKEYETAEMIEQLALIDRQYVDWGIDRITIEEEIKSVQAYLKLQKYRFKERLSYEIEVREDCKHYTIPKLSLVTFTENACVHGVEDKAANCWVFVRVYQDQQNLYLEIEDTGNGMTKSYVQELLNRMENAQIDMLQEKGPVGMVNACLRLKMYTKNQVQFSIESEESVGTLITISIPRNHLY